MPIQKVSAISLYVIHIYSFKTISSCYPTRPSSKYISPNSNPSLSTLAMATLGTIPWLSSPMTLSSSPVEPHSGESTHFHTPSSTANKLVVHRYSKSCKISNGLWLSISKVWSPYSTNKHSLFRNNLSLEVNKLDIPQSAKTLLLSHVN